MKEFTGKVAIITGAASGVGYAIAERCAQEGMNVGRNAQVPVSVLCPGMANTRIVDAARNRPLELQNEPSNEPTSPIGRNSKESIEALAKREENR